jgi:hypothetical protein
MRIGEVIEVATLPQAGTKLLCNGVKRAERAVAAAHERDPGSPTVTEEGAVCAKSVGLGGPGR